MFLFLWGNWLLNQTEILVWGPPPYEIRSHSCSRDILFTNRNIWWIIYELFNKNAFSRYFLLCEKSIFIIRREFAHEENWLHYQRYPYSNANTTTKWLQSELSRCNPKVSLRVPCTEFKVIPMWSPPARSLPPMDLTRLGTRPHIHKYNRCKNYILHRYRLRIVFFGMLGFNKKSNGPRY